MLFLGKAKDLSSHGLPFGYSLAPRVYTKILKPFVATKATKAAKGSNCFSITQLVGQERQ